jgi:hypothetical protein
LDEIDKYIDEYTGPPGSQKVNWPGIKKSEKLPQTILIPQRDYSKINRENAITALRARRFKRGIEKAVIDEYKRANELWLKNETGFDRDNLPKKKQGPIKRVREIGPNSYILILMTREEKPDYRKAVAAMREELKKLAEGEDGKLRKLYRVKEDEGILYINIQKLSSRLEKLLKPNVNARYNTVP